MLKCGWCSIYGVHDEAKDKEFELEMSWVCDESDRQFVRVRTLEPIADLFLPVQLTSSGVHESLTREHILWLYLVQYVYLSIAASRCMYE